MSVSNIKPIITDGNSQSSSLSNSINSTALKNTDIIPEVMVLSDEDYQNAEQEYYHQLMKQYNQFMYPKYLSNLIEEYNKLPEEVRNRVSFMEWQKGQISYDEWLNKQTTYPNPSEFMKNAPNFQQAYSNSNKGKKVYRQGGVNPSDMIDTAMSNLTANNPTSLLGKRGGSNEQNHIYQKLASMGYNSAAICAILSNMQHESGFNPTIYGDGGTSYGLCQWHAGRFTNLKNYCASRGLDYRTIDGQLEYLNYELRTSYPRVYQKLMSVPNTSQGAYQAAYTWTVDFEVPADRYNKGRQRGNTASGTYWNNFGDH